MGKFILLPNEIKLMVLGLLPLRDIYAFTRTCKANHWDFLGVILRRSDPIASAALSQEIRKWASKNKLIQEKAAKERLDNEKPEENTAAAESETNYILYCNRRALQLDHFWLAVELADCSIISRLARETNIKEEWEEFRDLGLGSKKRQMFDHLLKLSMEPPTANDLVGALLDLLKIDKSCGDAEGAHRLTQALFTACRFGNLELVKKLIALGADPGGVFEHEWPLMVACNTGNKELFDLLLDSGASIKRKYGYPSQITTLGAAIKGNNVEIVQHLLDNEEFIQEVNCTMSDYAHMLFPEGSDSREHHEVRQMLYERLDIKHALDNVSGEYVSLRLLNAVKDNNLEMTKLLLKPLLEQAADERLLALKCGEVYDQMLGNALDEQSHDVVEYLLGAFPRVFRSIGPNTASCKARAAILDRAMQTDDTYRFNEVLAINDLAKQTTKGDTLLHYIREPSAAENLLLASYHFGPFGDRISIDALSPSDETPLIKACHQNNIGMANFLLCRNADVKTRDKHGRRCLQVAVEKADAELVCKLLEYGAYFGAGNDEIATTLSIAIYHKRREVLETLLVEGPPVCLSVFEILEEEVEAARIKEEELREFSTLVTRLNRYTKDVARTLLDTVMRDSQVELSIVERLLKGGADPSPSEEDAQGDAQGDAQENAQEYAREDAEGNAQEYTDKIPSQITSPLALACYHGRKDIAEKLFAHGAIVENDEEGTSPSNPRAWTTLQAAVAGGHKEMVLWLLNGKADISKSKRDRDSWHSLCMVAIEAGLGMLIFLFEQGKAYLSRDSIEGILRNGVQRNQVEIVQYLIQDFGFTKADFDRMDLLHRARRNRRMMKTLQNYGADINSLDTHGRTVLHYAAEDSYPLLVAFLLCRGADATIRDKDKHSLAIDYAPADSRVPQIFKNYERKQKSKDRMVGYECDCAG